MIKTRSQVQELANLISNPRPVGSIDFYTHMNVDERRLRIKQLSIEWLAALPEDEWLQIQGFISARRQGKIYASPTTPMLKTKDGEK